MAKYTPEEAIQWREEYENGASMYDISAATCATPRPVSCITIRRAIVEAGGTIETQKSGAIKAQATRQRWWKPE